MSPANLTRHLIALRRRRDRATGLKRHQLRRSHLDREPQGRVYLGQGSLTDSVRHVKYVDRREPLYPYTWGELGREWVTEQFAALGAESYRLWLGQARNADLPPALYFQPGPTPGEWAYVDIAACYGTLLGHWPVDTRYIHALALKAGHHLYRPVGATLPTADLIACKPLRLAVWGTLRGGRLQWRTAKGWGSTIAADRLTRPGLTGLVLIAVHEIAWRAVHDFGARMWLTDAAILPLDRLFGFLDYLKGWGLRARLKAAGGCELTGLGAYRVGDKRSDTYPRTTPRANTLLKPLAWRRAA